MLEIEHLSLGVPVSGGLVPAVSDVSFSLKPGQVLGLVGESGCGKTLCAQSILRLGEHQGIGHMQGRIVLDGNDIFAMDNAQLQKVRGGRIGMVFQEPMTALNPVFSIGAQITEVIRLHQDASRVQARKLALDLLEDVGLRDADRLLEQYPDSLSGGMRQRVLIAMAMAGRPDYVIADEPTTALDVSVQARIVQLLRRLQHEHGVGLLLVTHDFGLVAELADDVAVMYAGQIVEQGPVAHIFDRPAHPYTRALLACRPEVAEQGKTLPVISGQVPPPGSWPAGCRFANRCAWADEGCDQGVPERAWGESAHWARCIHVDRIADVVEVKS